MKQPESEVFADATNAAGALWKRESFAQRAEALYEKNAIFSAWLMRRIGASGSLAAMTGFRSMPLAMMARAERHFHGGAGAGQAPVQARFDGAGRDG